MAEQLTKAEKKYVSDLGKAVLAYKKATKGGTIRPARKSEFYGSTGGTYRPLFTTGFNGEKNLGEIGPIKRYLLDYEALRLRSWQSFLESEITQTVIGKYIMWVVGTGLKPQSEPATDILKDEGITLDKEVYSKKLESRWGLFADSDSSDWAGMDCLNILESVAYKNSILGGDVLVVLRYDGEVKIQLIDGTHVQSPLYGSEQFVQVLSNGNRLMNGIEISPRGEHMAYWVRRGSQDLSPFTYDRISAKGAESGMTMAFMVYGMKYRLDNVRGMPLIGVILETLKKLERYKEATVGSAEERQKIAFFVTHNTGSTGENPLQKDLTRALKGVVDDDDDIPVDVNGKQIADLIATTTDKQAFNLPIESDIKSLGSDTNELSFKDFYTTNINLICAALNIPPDVAMSMYNSNYSASRAAIKDWEHILTVKRYQYAKQFKQKVMNFWLTIQILENKISAPGYLKAFQTQDTTVLNCFRRCRWVGAQVPHIDPLKEVLAEREKLGVTGAAIPLTTAERSAEILGGGDFDAIIEQYASELQRSKDLKIEEPKPELPPAGAPIKPVKKKKKKEKS